MFLAEHEPYGEAHKISTTACEEAVKEFVMSLDAANGAAAIDEHSAVTRRISRFALQQRSRIEQPERDDGTRRLMWAMLKDTLRCYHMYHDSVTVRGQRLFHDAERWIQSRDLKWAFSFENVCAVLGVDSDYLRNELQRRQRSRRNGLVS
jgi:hypothetical protein